MDQTGKVGTITFSIFILGLVTALVVTKLGGGVVFSAVAAFAASATLSVALRGTMGRWFEEVVRTDEELSLAYSEHMTHVPKRMVSVGLLAAAFGIGGVLTDSPSLLAAAGALLGTSVFPLVVKSAVKSGTS